MPYNEPRKLGNRYVLPKKDGGVHRSSSGTVVRYKSKAAAKRSARYIMALEHGMKPKII